MLLGPLEWDKIQIYQLIVYAKISALYQGCDPYGPFPLPALPFRINQRTLGTTEIEVVHRRRRQSEALTSTQRTESRGRTKVLHSCVDKYIVNTITHTHTYIHIIYISYTYHIHIIYISNAYHIHIIYISNIYIYIYHNLHIVVLFFLMYIYNVCMYVCMYVFMYVCMYACNVM